MLSFHTCTILLPIFEIRNNVLSNGIMLVYMHLSGLFESIGVNPSRSETRVLCKPTAGGQLLPIIQSLYKKVTKQFYFHYKIDDLLLHLIAYLTVLITPWPVPNSSFCPLSPIGL